MEFWSINTPPPIVVGSALAYPPVIHNPSIILLDEPGAGLDTNAVIRMKEILKTIDSRDRTIVMTTHNLEQGLEICDQVAILNNGKIVYEASKQRINPTKFQEIYNYHTLVSS